MVGPVVAGARASLNVPPSLMPRTRLRCNFVVSDLIFCMCRSLIFSCSSFITVWKEGLVGDGICDLSSWMCLSPLVGWVAWEDVMLRKMPLISALMILMKSWRF